MGVDYLVVTRADDIADIVGTVFASSFPAAELATAADLIQGVLEGRVSVLAAREAGQWLGAAVLERFGQGTSVLTYLAVAGATRGKGVGHGLLSAVSAMVARSGGDYFLAEIEPPGSTPERPEHGDPGRRARFYDRAGAKALPIRHWQPPAAPGLPFIPLTLIALPAGRPLPASLPADRIIAFERTYHASDLRSAALEATIASFLGRESLPLADLDDLYR